MQKVAAFFRREAVLAIALSLALLSLFITPPDALYAGYVDLNVLMMLFCLMTVVSGLQRCGAFRALAGRIVKRARGTRGLCLMLVLACFFSSMLVTNDVALITFVPLTLLLLSFSGERCLLRAVVLETVAANLGSMATPIGNPQNLFLYTRYSLRAGDFFRAVLPLALLSLLSCALLCLLVPDRRVSFSQGGEEAPLNRKLLLFHGALFALCLLCVLKLLPVAACFAAVALLTLLFDRQALFGVDYALLMTFVCFFVFVGNVGRVPAVSQALSGAMAGRETTVSALCSQVVSNVPAAILLAPFTEDAAALLRGVNIGGLGTPIASLASLISLKFYLRRTERQTGRYLLFFSAVNFGLLLFLLLLCGALYPAA